MAECNASRNDLVCERSSPHDMPHKRVRTVWTDSAEGAVPHKDPGSEVPTWQELAASPAALVNDAAMALGAYHKALDRVQGRDKRDGDEAYEAVDLSAVVEGMTPTQVLRLAPDIRTSYIYGFNGRTL